MKYLGLPNIPESTVKLALVDGRISPEVEKNLSELGITLIKTRPYPGMYEAVSYHPDIMFHHISYENLVYAPGVNDDILSELLLYRFKMIKGSTCLTGKYPGNIAYNVARIGNLAFHNTKYTDPVLKDELHRTGVELVHVNQGYTKCAVSVVNKKSMITSDMGIARAAEKRGLNVLWIEPEENIVLEGLKHGFIGGSSGLLDKDLWSVSGDFDTLKSAWKVREFLENCNKKVISLSDGRIVDMGTIIPLLLK